MTLKLDNGNQGGGIFIGEDAKIEIFRGRVTSNPPELVNEKIRDDEIHLYESNNHMGNFFQCIETGARPISDVVTVGNGTITCHLANIALRLGRKLTWDPATETFVGDEEANRMRSRAARQPWAV